MRPDNSEEECALGEWQKHITGPSSLHAETHLGFPDLLILLGLLTAGTSCLNFLQTLNLEQEAKP